MISLIYFRFLFASVIGMYNHDPSSKIVRWNVLDTYLNYIDVIDNVYASELAIDENGQRLYWINILNRGRYILPVYS